MGCGISTLDAEEKSLSRHSSRHGRHRAIVPPLAEKKDDDHGVGFSQGKDVMVVMKPLDDENEEGKKESEVGPNEEKLKEKCVMDKKDEEEERVFESRGKEDNGGDEKQYAKINVKNEENNDGDDSFIGPGSPSFRDYCIDYDSADRSSMGDSNDCDSVESTKNGSEFDLSYMLWIFLTSATFLHML